MQNLLTALKQEHEALKAQVALIKQHGVVTPDGFAGLQRLREILHAHVLHEDLDLYPRLEQAAVRDDNLRTLLDRFRGEMQEITAEANQFYQRYSAPVQSLDYARDVARLFSLLTNRIVTEEAVLYPYLEKAP
ncbi:hemerythrin domain-containing protein [Trichlorobacter ammonificans]|uniref:Hemerythrin domain-containing protein n=1 Tax=Trichlorobacter ammonificans TaxID=2916410 RepID=A0ABN8HG29_9BACT|nr:hemerythrin domain-containing protein [Trichlorobacter ammonificans]CAH2030103.1 Hemerythrin domain-containing protein [Trichlorobacter ammonificans]